MTAPGSVHRPVAVPEPLARELDEGHQHVRRRLMATLRGFSASPALVGYVGDLRLYLRAAYLLTMWLPDVELRREVGGDLAMHIVAMKLFDDLLDDDSGFDRFELALCLLLEQQATTRLAARAQDPRAVLTSMEADFVTVGTGQLRTKREPALDLPSWRAHADTYGACFLGLYGTVAALSGRQPGALAAATDFGRGFGMLVTIADDMRDYVRHGERTGNLGCLLLTGRTTEAEIRDLVEESRRLATPPPDVPAAHDVTPIVDLYADDVLYRVLPQMAALRAENDPEVDA